MAIKIWIDWLILRMMNMKFFILVGTETKILCAENEKYCGWHWQDKAKKKIYCLLSSAESDWYLGKKNDGIH